MCIFLTHGYDENGERVEFNYDFNRWEYLDGNICIDGYKKRICEKCNKPRIDINGVEDVDFCLQGLTTTDFISHACCGHGDKDAAYIALKDGRRFILDKEWSIKEDEED